MAHYGMKKKIKIDSVVIIPKPISNTTAFQVIPVEVLGAKRSGLAYIRP